MRVKKDEGFALPYFTQEAKGRIVVLSPSDSWKQRRSVILTDTIMHYCPSES